MTDLQAGTTPRFFVGGGGGGGGAGGLSKLSGKYDNFNKRQHPQGVMGGCGGRGRVWVEGRKEWV